MPDFGVAIAWMIISPMAFITDIIGVIICLHYKSSFHSCDVAFISIFVTMATSSVLLFPVSAVIRLGDLSWNKHLCLFYTWLWITLRTSHLLVLLVVNVYWVASLRMSPKGRMFVSSTPMKASIGVCWLVSAVAGLPPVVGGTQIFQIFQNDVCNFLPANVNVGYAVFFVILSLVSVIMGFISALDTLLVLRSMRDAAVGRYRAAGMHVPTFSGGVDGRSQAHAKYNQLDVSIELCQLVLCFSLLSAAMDALPLLVSQFMELTQKLDLETLEVTLLWLWLIESLTLPHVLWVLSRRYQHAAAYTWRVFVLRDESAVEEGATTCTLQAFRMKVKDTDDMHRVRPLQTNGARPRPSIPVLNCDMVPVLNCDMVPVLNCDMAPVLNCDMLPVFNCNTAPVLNCDIVESTDEDSKSRTHDIIQDDTNGGDNMTTTDRALTAATPMTSSGIVLHKNIEQEITYTTIRGQGQNTSFLPLSQRGTQGLTHVQSSEFSHSDVHANHRLVYASTQNPLTTFTYDSGKQLAKSTSRNQIKELNRQHTGRNAGIHLHTVAVDTEKDTVSYGDDEYSRHDILQLCDKLNTAFVCKSVIENKCSCYHISTQRSAICDDNLDCTNNVFTNSLIQKIYLKQGIQKADSADDSDNKLTGFSSKAQPQIIIPDWPLLENISTRDQYAAEYTAQEKKAVCCDTNLQCPHAIVNGVQNTGNAQLISTKHMQKYTVVLGVYYDDTNTLDNNEHSELS